jgi:hypothetical protein
VADYRSAWLRSEAMVTLNAVGNNRPFAIESRGGGGACQTEVSAVGGEVDEHVPPGGSKGVLHEDLVSRLAVQASKQRRAGVAAIVDLEEISAVLIARVADVLRVGRVADAVAAAPQRRVSLV